MPGKVEWIGVRPERKADVIPVQQVNITVEDGLQGDHRAQPHRQVTLIRKEGLKQVASSLGKETIDPAATRRNILVSGLQPEIGKGQKLKVGSTILEITGECHPCSRMDENLGDGGRKAMAGHGGMTARVVSPGSVSIGDTAEIEPG